MKGSGAAVPLIPAETVALPAPNVGGAGGTRLRRIRSVGSRPCAQDFHVAPNMYMLLLRNVCKQRALSLLLTI